MGDDELINDGINQNLDEGHVIYVGNNNLTVGGNGSYENPFSNFSLACDNINGQEKVTVKVFNGTYKLGAQLNFNTSNLYIEGINGKVIIKNLYSDAKLSKNTNHAEAFGLTSSLSNFTFSNIIFDISERNNKLGTYISDKNSAYFYFFPFYGKANSGIFYNCSFVGFTDKTYITGSSEYNSQFINCIFDIHNTWNKIFQEPFTKDMNHIFKYCVFNLPVSSNQLGGVIYIGCNISIDSSWFGQNNLPEYIGPFIGNFVTNPDGTYNHTYSIPVNRYAIFSALSKTLLI